VLAAWSSAVPACGRGASSPDAAPTAAAAARTPDPPPPPSFVLLLADDLDVPSMPELDTLSALFAEGVRFASAYTSQPLCTPSRASLLTGQYMHNHRVLRNVPPEGGYPVFRPLERQTIAVLLREAGYRTGLIGKYLNSYPEDVPAAEAIPPGWDRWYARATSFGGERYYNYFVNDQGALCFRGAEPEDYDTDVLAAEVEAFLEVVAEDGGPFFLLVGLQAPHIYPITAAERHWGRFASARAPRLPSFNERDVSDKPAWVQNTPLLTRSDIRRLDRLQQGRLASMLAVEELVQRLLASLDGHRLLDNTYVLLTSDNGLCMGAHRLLARKRNFYEESVRVPLIVRGPGLAPGRTVDALVELIDIPATLADLAGIGVPERFDGRSLRPLLFEGTAPADWRQTVLLENFAGELSFALRTGDYLYAEISALERELYDMRSDPYQLENQAQWMDATLLEPLSLALRERSRCQGEGCR
jgi:arylsulfatase A-like enzyme